MKHIYPADKDSELTKEVKNLIISENGEQLSERYCKSDGILWADVFEKFINVSIEELDIIPPYCVSLPGYSW